MSFDPAATTIGSYFAAEWSVFCRVCDRQETVTKWRMNQEFGPDVTLHDAALRMAAGNGCARGPGGCNVAVLEVPVTTWGRLSDAIKGGWRPFLVCHRRHAGLKSVKSCPERVELNLETLAITHGDSFQINRLPRRCRCPGCGTDFVDIEWHVPAMKVERPEVRELTIDDLREQEFKRRAAARG